MNIYIALIRLSNLAVFESTVTTAVDFGVTQVVDGNWGVHADIPK